VAKRCCRQRHRSTFAIRCSTPSSDGLHGIRQRFWHEVVAVSAAPIAMKGKRDGRAEAHPASRISRVQFGSVSCGDGNWMRDALTSGSNAPPLTDPAQCTSSRMLSSPACWRQRPGRDADHSGMTNRPTTNGSMRAERSCGLPFRHRIGSDTASALANVDARRTPRQSWRQLLTGLLRRQARSSSMNRPRVPERPGLLLPQ